VREVVVVVVEVVVVVVVVVVDQGWEEISASLLDGLWGVDHHGDASFGYSELHLKRADQQT
jgi:hypothetical protein